MTTLFLKKISVFCLLLIAFQINGKSYEVFSFDFENTKTILKYPSKPMRYFTNHKNNSIISSDGNTTMHISNDPDKSRNSNKVLTVPLNYDDPISYRTEIKIESFPEFKKNIVYEISFEIYIPQIWQWDELSDMIMQLHAVPDKFEFNRNPPLGLEIINNKFKFIIYSDKNKRTITNIFTKKHQYSNTPREYFIGDVTKERWHGFTIQFKNSYEDDGYVNIYLDRKLVLQDKGPNCFNDEKGLYLKLGNYKYAWRKKTTKNITNRLHFIDNIKIYQK